LVKIPKPFDEAKECYTTMGIVTIYFMRHGVSLWNRRGGTVWYPQVMQKYGAGDDAAKAAGVDEQEWQREMARCLCTPSNNCMRDDPESEPSPDVVELDKLLVDPALTFEGKISLRLAAREAAKELNLPVFKVCVVSPMLRTLQTASIASCYFPLADDCLWALHSDVREHNHKGWIDTWGTASTAKLRALAAQEIAAHAGLSEMQACKIRAPLQKQLLDSTSEGCLHLQAEIIRQHEGGIDAFVADLNSLVTANEEDEAAAHMEAEMWSRVMQSDPTFHYRPEGDLGAVPVVAKFSTDLTQRWWMLDETEEDLHQRVVDFLAAELVRSAPGPVLVVTHSMFIREAMKILVTCETQWTGPADMPKSGELVANGGVFLAKLDLDTGKATEAGLFTPPSSSSSI